MTDVIRTNSTNPDFIALVKALDAELAERDGREHSFYNQFNKIDNIPYVVVVYEDGQPVACGALKPLESDALEVKRMYTKPERRGHGLAGAVLQELERWAPELGYKTCRLETGKRQPEAIALYQKSGYKIIPNYGQYAGVANSVCFEKQLSPMR